METQVNTPVIVALDYGSAAPALELVARLSPGLCRLKIGKELFTRAGPALVETLQKQGFEVFLDLKFHDIPNTVQGAVRSALAIGADMMTFHASGGPTMLRAAREAVDQANRSDVILVAVTVLTHLDEKEWNTTFGGERGLEETVLSLARTARASGMTGVVASARELPAIKRALGAGCVVVTPGIRLPGAGKDDQTRVVTPEQAIRDGADYLVVGRPIVAAPDPVAACREVVARMTA